MQRAVFAWRRVVAALVVATVVVLLLGVGSQWLRYVAGHDHLRGLVPRLDLNAERSLPAAFSALLLGFTGAVAGVVALLERARRSRWWRHWAGLAALLALMSIEEVADFHTIELIPREQAIQVSSLLHMTWVLFGAAFVLLFAATYFRFWWRMAPGTRWRFFVAGAVYVSGALIMEMIGGSFYIANGNGFALSLVLAVEEGLELAGVLLLLAALFHHLQLEFGTIALSLAGAPARARGAEREVPVPGRRGPEGAVPVPQWATADLRDDAEAHGAPPRDPVIGRARRAD